MYEWYFIAWQFSIPPKSQVHVHQRKQLQKEQWQRLVRQRRMAVKRRWLFLFCLWAESSFDTLTHREQARPDAQMGDAQRASCCKVKCPLSPCLREPDINCIASPVIPLPIKLLLFESYQLECFFSARRLQPPLERLLLSLGEVSQQGSKALSPVVLGKLTVPSPLQN